VRSTRTTLALAVAALLLISAGVIYVSRRLDRLPARGSQAYEETTRTFYLGLASLQVGLLDRAKQEFTHAAGLIDGEPASWANLGVVHLRLGEIDAAQAPIERAAALAPGNSEIALLLGRLETARGRIDPAVSHFRRAIDLDARNLRARFALAQELERSGGADADAQAQKALEDLLAIDQDNLAVQLERTRLAVKRADGAALRDSIARLEGRRSSWLATALEQFEALRRAVEAQDYASAARAAAFLRNVLLPTAAFQEGRGRVSIATGLIAEPFERFLKLAPPGSAPSPSDTELAFVRESTGNAPAGPWTSVLAASLDGSAVPAVFGVAGGEVRRIDDGRALPAAPGSAVVPVPGHGLLALDWNHDFRMDLVAAGSGGVRLLLQGEDGSFADSTATATAAASPIGADATGAWAADVEMDGDLDLVVGIDNAAPLVLRNNGDGTWRALEPFAGVPGARGFGWGDLDHDGDPDAILVDQGGGLHLFANRQAGEFTRIPAPAFTSPVIAVTIGDTDADGLIDILALDAGGAIRRAAGSPEAWRQDALATWSEMPKDDRPGRQRLMLADLDNNGALDLVASGPGRTAIWLAGDQLDFGALRGVPEVEVFSIADLSGDGLLDLVGLAGGQPVRLLGRSNRGYHWQVIRPKAQPTAGDQRINSFGVGGEVEVRSGLLVQKQILTGGPAHFGLGTRTRIDVARILWPNGVRQAEFDRAADEAIVAEQRLSGSCPWVFAYDGRGMGFVTDFLWRSPLGLRINAQDTAGISQTEDWVKIRGDQLVPKDGVYDVRITAELWETHFFDHVSLMAVDHPADAEVFVDERFSKAPPALAVHAMTPPRPVARAWDHTGRDVTDVVARRDGRYLATLERGRYQGVAREHFVEIDPGADLPRGHPWLVAHGWVYPTDSSINMAIAQGRHDAPRGLALEALDATGRWIVVETDLGFPAGKNKTVLIDLSRAISLAADRRLRLRTNLEVYWDSLGIAAAIDAPSLETIRLQPAVAELRYRGFSRTEHERRDLPELPLYHEIAGVGQRWRDLVGYYTRFGPVGELLGHVDDRYVIMNAGDELLLRFPVPKPPRPGWTRDFVLIGDGWEKDGNYNTGYSQTVLPLPAHDRREYAGPLDLERDPVYRRHAGDWLTYHTRFVTPDEFLRGLRWGP
jgi:tetratricopeptide (TPR) repeat protein